jgi:SAM-dependent methyltransferase
MTNYSDRFYISVTARATHTAEILAEFLKPFYSPKRFIDIGSGQGIWTLKFHETFKFKEITAVDLPGSEFNALSEITAPYKGIGIDFENEMLPDGAPFDLGVCVEVLEHITEPRAILLMEWFSRNIKVGIFSGATPGQGGTKHINEQHKYYWLSKFLSMGFIAIDSLRPAMSTERLVPSYYRNNIFLLVNTKFLNDIYVQNLLISQSKIENYGFKDLRNGFEKLKQFFVNFLPESIVTLLAKLKSLIIFQSRK